MARARKSINTDHLILADSLEAWGRAHGAANDPYVAGLTHDLRENADLPIWATMDPMEYLPQPTIASTDGIHEWTRRLTVIRNVLVFAPVALTWLAVGNATSGFSKYIKVHGTSVVNFLDFWQNGYNTLSSEWRIGNVATLDFSIIATVIALTLTVSVMARRSNALHESAERKVEADRVRIAIAISKFLFAKRTMTTLTVNASLANSVTKLANAAHSVEATAKSLEKSTKKLPARNDAWDYLNAR